MASKSRYLKFGALCCGCLYCFKIWCGFLLLSSMYGFREFASVLCGFAIDGFDLLFEDIWNALFLVCVNFDVFWVSVWCVHEILRWASLHFYFWLLSSLDLLLFLLDCVFFCDCISVCVSCPNSCFWVAVTDLLSPFSLGWWLFLG